MSSEGLEQTVQAIIPLLESHFVDRARRHFRAEINNFKFLATQTTERAGVSGRVMISKIYYETEYGEGTENIALKFFQNSTSATTEIKNAIELEIKFRAAPEFGIPKLIFASTRDPVLIIYEGIEGTNYDELSIGLKAWEAGRLLATIHGFDARPVDNSLYQGLSRMIGKHIAQTGMELEISQGLGFFYQRLEGALSGCNPFSDFHQSNVMIKYNQSTHSIDKVYIIDPEFMQKGSFDRLEDAGTFFGAQLFDEFTSTGKIIDGITDVNEFIAGYQGKMVELGGLTFVEMYPKGCPLPFFISQWAIMDALDISINRGGDLNSEETMSRLKFAKFILSLKNEFQFPV